MYRIAAGFFAILIGLSAIGVIYIGEFTGGFGPQAATNPKRITRRDSPLQFWSIVIMLLLIAVYLGAMAWTGWPLD